MKENEKIISITATNFDAAYAIADDKTRKVLDALRGENLDRPKPTLSDYTTIRSYEDACEALGIEPKLNNILMVCDGGGTELFNLPKHIVAMMKLEVICKALWGGENNCTPTADGSKVWWYPIMALWTPDEVAGMNDKQRGALLSAGALYGAYAGFGCLHADSRSSWSRADGGFRLCLDTEEKAEYFGKQFVELWAEYLAYNFTVGERLK